MRAHSGRKKRGADAPVAYIVMDKKSRDIRREIRNRTVGYILAALGLVAGLAWNDAIGALIRYLLPLDTQTLAAKFAYAVVITLVVVLAAWYAIEEQEENGPQK